MGIIVRQSVSNTVISYAGIALGFVLTILLYPHILAPEEYGLTRVLISASFIGSRFAHLGFKNIVIRYFPFFRRIEPVQHGFLFWVITIPFAGFLLYVAVYLLAGELIINHFRERSPLFVEYYLWVIPLTLFLVYFEVLNNYLRSLRDSVTGSLVNEVYQRALTILLLILYFFNWLPFWWFVILFVLSYGLQPLMILERIRRKGELRLKPNFDFVRRPLIKGMARYGFFSLLGGLTTVIVWNVDVLMLGSMAGLDQTGIYAIAFYIASIVSVPQRSIEKIAGPLVADYIKNKQWTDVDSIYKKTSINQLIPGILIFGLVWLHLDTLFLLMPDVYATGKWVVFIIGIGKLFEVVCGVNGIILLNSRHYMVSFYTNLILIGITVTANYLLIPPFGMEGAAVASAFALFIFNGVKSLYIFVRLGMHPFTVATVWITMLGICSVYLCYAVIDFGSLWLNIPLKTLLFLIFYFAPLVYLNVSPDLNKLLQSIQKKVLP